MKRWLGGVLWLLAAAAPLGARAVDVDQYIRNDRFGEIRISPGGEYFAGTVPIDDGERTGLVIMRRSDMEVTATFVRGKNSHIADFTWVNDERVLISASEKIGALEKPRLTGEIYAISADGSQAEILVGQRVVGRGIATRIKPKKVEMVQAYLVDDLPADDKYVIISVSPFSTDPYTDAERLHVYSGRRDHVASAPVANGRFVTDNSGVVRFAVGSGPDNSQQVYYRTGENADWELINDESASGLRKWPVGFSTDNKVAYLEAEMDQGPNAILAFDIASRASTLVLRDDNVDPLRILYRNNSSVPIGAVFIDGRPKTEFFDAESPEARLYRSLEAAFGGDPVLIASRTADGSTALVETWSDRNPGDFYLFDTIGKAADHLVSRRIWFDPARMAAKRPITVPSRDGWVLHGYLTVPKGSDGKPVPMVVMPHGGPFGVRDTWEFDSEVQMLADAGYAVLQINFRGSGGYGKAFHESGARQWGGAMQNDLTDATRWAIEQGIADPDRVCIYGASYGGYAALMGAAKEPGLYKCAAGYVGVYDLAMMHADDSKISGRMKAWVSDWVGDPEQLGAVSPNRLAGQIQVPVFLAAGGEDSVAPIEHSERMEQALRKAGVPVETLYYDTEGHGFYLEEHRREYYTQLLAFLARSLGGEVAGSSRGGQAAATAAE